MKNWKRKALMGLVACSSVVPATAQLIVDLEAGAAFPGAYNDIQIPRQTGTRFNAFGPNFEKSPLFFYRGRLGYTFNDRHTFIALVAPLALETRTGGNLTSPVLFQGALFGTDRPLAVRYQFNSHRLTYRYNFVRSQTWRVGAGLTAKLRDASVRLNDGQRQALDENRGFVPLINLFAHWTPNGRVGLIVEGDVITAPGFGRATDVFGGLTYRLRGCTALKVGYRILEGGSDVEQTLNLVLVHYASAGLIIGL